MWSKGTVTKFQVFSPFCEYTNSLPASQIPNLVCGGLYETDSNSDMTI